MTPAQAEVARRLEALGAGAHVVGLAGSVPLGGRGPVDTDVVDDRSMLRVCVSTLAGLAPQLPPTTSPRERWAWLRRPPVEPVLHGAVDEVVGAWWEQRVAAGSGVRWRRAWRGLRAADRLPVVAGVPAPLDPVGTDLLRRVNQVLATAPDGVRHRARDLVVRRPGVALGVPGPYHAWARGAAERAGLGVPSTDAARPRSVPVAAALARALEELGDGRWLDA